jgi:hypothetical protein
VLASGPLTSRIPTIAAVRPPASLRYWTGLYPLLVTLLINSVANVFAHTASQKVKAASSAHEGEQDELHDVQGNPPARYGEQRPRYVPRDHRMENSRMASVSGVPSRTILRNAG